MCLQCIEGGGSGDGVSWEGGVQNIRSYHGRIGRVSWVHWRDIMSALGGCHECIGGYQHCIGDITCALRGCTMHWGISWAHWQDIMICVGHIDIISAFVRTQCIWGISWIHLGNIMIFMEEISSVHRGCSTTILISPMQWWYPTMCWWFPPMHWRSPFP